MRTTTIVLVSVFLLAYAPGASADDGDAIVGVWLTEDEGDPDGRVRVEVTEDDGTYSGVVVWVEKPTYPPDDDRGMGGQKRVDRENPDPALRSRPLMGLPIVEGFEYAGKGSWKNAHIYDPDNGKTYKCKAKLLEDGTLKIRGFIGVSLLGRTTFWTRIK